MWVGWLVAWLILRLTNCQLLSWNMVWQSDALSCVLAKWMASSIQHPASSIQHPASIRVTPMGQFKLLSWAVDLLLLLQETWRLWESAETVPSIVHPAFGVSSQGPSGFVCSCSCIISFIIRH
jgi:hypothetical protein